MGRWKYNVYLQKTLPKLMTSKNNRTNFTRLVFQQN